MDNAHIADRLDAFAALLELAEANPYTARAYRRAAETIRAAGVPVEPLVRSGQVRRLRGIGPGIEARLRELVETGEIAELTELERELAPELVGIGRYLGLSARRAIEIAQALGVRTLDELREAASAGRLTERAGHRAEDGGADPRRARPRAGSAARAPAQPAPRSWSTAWRRRSAARRPATRGAGATRASAWPWSAPT